MSLLIGIAIDRKLIGSVDEPVFSFLPEYSDMKTAEKDRIRIRDLLTMSAGLAADEDIWEMPGNTEREIYQVLRPVQTCA